MSPRAACRLETLGFDPTLVFDYVEGKAGWLASGLPREGTGVGILRAGDLADVTAPTCGLETPVAEIRELLEAAGYGFVLVVSGRRIVLGRVRRSTLTVDPSATAEDVMEPGPSTVRFDLRAGELVERLARRDLKTAVVTTPTGCLVGVFHRADAEARLAASRDQPR